MASGRCDSDPIFVKVAAEENDGNVELIEKTVAGEIPAGSLLRAQYDKVAPPAVAALKGFNRWMQEDLVKRTTTRTWRLGKDWYDEKFRLVMEAPVTPEKIHHSVADSRGPRAKAASSSSAPGGA